MEFDILEDGEPPQSIYFPMEPGTDVRYLRGESFKPTVQTPPGVVWTLSLRAYKGSSIVNRRIVGGTLVASATCSGITILP